MESSKKARWAVGDTFEAVIEKVAHGGHFIVRQEGAVFFVRHGIPGEKCRIVITSTGSSFNRADVVEVLEPSNDRVSAPCQYAHRSGCGGCDFQHISLTRQRQLKADVITEQFARIAKMDLQVQVEEVGAPLHWRTRSIATTNNVGELGFYGARSHTVVPIKDCLITVDEMNMPELVGRKWKPDVRVEIATSNMGERNIALAPKRGEGKARLTEGAHVLHEKVAGKILEVSQDSFWQSHVKAPEILTNAVLDYAQLQLGEHVLDLYGGVGLFTSAMVDVVGSDGSVVLIEGSKSATGDAARNFADKTQVKILTGDVAKLLPQINSAHVVVLDPPREGAGKTVLAQISRLTPRAVVYVACDPAALARDTAYFLELGYSLSKIKAFDLFPMTHHVECVALFMPA
jgi:tRNA/tmRNA/rRNA uracil-C5-methylase (TrmA/RlmC/RlmD family)